MQNMFQIGLLNFRTGLFGSHFKDSLNNESLDWLISENIQEKPINLMLKNMVSSQLMLKTLVSGFRSYYFSPTKPIQ
jgi:hypothetical protein